MPETEILLPFEGRLYKITPDIRLVFEIEDELGGLVLLKNRFSENAWAVSDLVTLTHMMLAFAGKTVDYGVLGNYMIRHGLSSYLSVVLKFLQLVVSE